MSDPQAATTLTPADLEALIRRIVREEIGRLLHQLARSIPDDWKQECPDDPESDAVLLGEALAVLQEYGDKPDAWMSWEDFETELDRAEAAGELPDYAKS